MGTLGVRGSPAIKPPSPRPAAAPTPTEKPTEFLIRGRERVGSAVADQSFRLAMLACGLAVLAILGLIVLELISSSRLALHQFGWRFFTGQTWDPVSDSYGALPFIYGTLVS